MKWLRKEPKPKPRYKRIFALIPLPCTDGYWRFWEWLEYTTWTDGHPDNLCIDIRPCSTP